MTSRKPRSAVFAATVVAAAGIVALTGPSAAAGTVTVPYLCNAGSIVVVPTTFHITVTAPATVHRGQTATVRVDILQEDGRATRDYPANTWTGHMDLRLAGAGSGTVRASGLANPPIRAGDRFRYEGGRAQVTFANAGVVTFTPDVKVLNSRQSCIVRTPPAPVAASTNVT